MSQSRLFRFFATLLALEALTVGCGDYPKVYRNPGGQSEAGGAGAGGEGNAPNLPTAGTGNIIDIGGGGEAGSATGGTSSVVHGCGDGSLDEGEECDDGNDENGDGCTSDCQTEEGYTCTEAGLP